MENKNNYAYRTIFAEYQKFYKDGKLDKLPNIEGRNYIKDKDSRCNNFNYDPETRYLHFFSNYHDAEEYAKALKKDFPSKKLLILKFKLPENLIQKSYLGRYFSFAEMRDVDRKEYIFPAEEYRAAFFIGEAGEGDREKNMVHYDPDSYGGGFFRF